MIFRTGFFGSLLAILSISMVLAQSSCEGLILDALEAVENNCEGLGRNSACYGYDQVEAGFLIPKEDDFFALPSDVADVAELQEIRTAPLDNDNGTWGVAVLNIQANLPNTLPGQTVTFILMGDVEVENAVAPENAFDPNDGVNVTINIPQGANIRSGAGTNFNVIGGARENEVLLADGLSEDGEWLRVAYRDRPAWISITVIDIAEDDLASLPTLTDDLVTPMQSIYLRTGIGEPVCGEAPDDILLVQGPENIEIALTVNGAEITLGSSGAFRIIEIDGEQFLEIIVFDGVFENEGVQITAGQRSILCLSDPDNRGLDGESNDRIVSCGASEPEDIDIDEFAENWCVIENVSSDIINYGIDIQCPGDPVVTPEPQAPSNNQGPPSEIESVNCSTFSLPAQPIPATDFTLVWNAAQGALYYEVAVFDSGGNLVTTILNIEGTSIGVNGGAFSNGGSIHVRAYGAEGYACYVSIGFTRTPDPNEPVGGYNQASFTASISCTDLSDYKEATVTWSNAQNGDTITFSNTGTFFTGALASNPIGTGDSGSATGLGNPDPSVAGVVSTSSGDSVNVSDICN